MSGEEGGGPVTPIRSDDAAPAARDRAAVDRRMLESIVCPVTQGRLDYDREAQELVSAKARLAFPIREGVPIMLVHEARQLDG